MLDFNLNRNLTRRVLIPLLFCIPVLSQGAFGTTHKPYANARYGAKLWVNHCARCHNLRSPDEFRPDQFRVIMAHMRIRSGITGQDTRDILAFLIGQINPGAQPDVKLRYKINGKKVSSNTYNNAGKKQTPLSGAAIYKQNCAVCHGANGKGAIPGAPDMTKPGSALSKSFNALIGSVKNGRGAMPANPNLTNEQLKAVINYIKYSF